MRIRVGYELNYEFPQPTPMIVTLNVHYSRVSDLVAARPHEHDAFGPDRRLSGRFRQLVHAPRGARRAFPGDRRRDRQRHGRAGPRRIRRAPAPRPAAAGGDAGLPAGQPLLRDRPPVGDRLGLFSHDARRLGARAGDLRLRPPAHQVRLRVRQRPPRPPGRRSTSAGASAATSPTWRSRFAAA